MPFRSKEVLESWLADYRSESSAGARVAEYADVAVQDGSDGSDTGLVIIGLRNATTDVYMQPVALGDPHWEVTFAARDRDLALSTEDVVALSQELAAAAELCAYLERRSREHLEAHGAGAAGGAPADEVADVVADAER
ncbi:hypothetical protein NVV95_05695 [Herbiconiux sp. CPCC 205716]|uniref:Uncharacterized protein n=1 Tax=Herbiconiux gentiana TaxID=2970912 RepID=A0ABT2GCX9_9MICO|nr:hypothetical protein [Herbiconiux gentiana]MCS5714042.1 hypothetical protein [Herbiconiux gentiana]